MTPRFDLDDYVPVAERVELFRADHPGWSLLSELLVDDGNRVLVRAKVETEKGRVMGTGHAEEIRNEGQVNRTSAIENAETSAWGRALACLGYGVKRGIASREEMAGAQRVKPPEPQTYAQKAVMPRRVDPLAQSVRTLPVRIPNPDLVEARSGSGTATQVGPGGKSTTVHYNDATGEIIKVAPDQGQTKQADAAPVATAARPALSAAAGPAPGPWAQKEALDRAMPSLKALTPGEMRSFREWMASKDIPQEAVRWTNPHLETVIAELQARGVWVFPDGDAPF